MKLSDLMGEFTPDPLFVGEIVADDWVFAIGKTTDDAVGDYISAQGHIAGLDANLNAVTQEKIYIREGQSSIRTGTQRTFKITGDRLIGNDFQDFVFSHEMKYGVGATVVRPYVYFNVRNGMGEKGMVSVSVVLDGGGKAGDASSVEVDFKKTGKTPEEYTYTAAPAGAPQTFAVNTKGVKTIGE